MFFIQLFGTLIYFIIICSLGTLITNRFLKEVSIRHLLSSFIIGSVVIGLIMFTLVELKLIYSAVIYSLTLIFLTITLLQIKFIFLDLKICYKFIKLYLFKEKTYSILFIISMILITIWLLFLAGTPPRSGDVMRYHLAQLKDIVWNHGFVFREYYHYNFPAYFGYTFLPVYIFLNGIGMQLAVLYSFFIVLFVTIRLSYKLNLKYPKLLLFLIILVPIAFQEAHIVFTDWQVVLYAMIGLLLFIEFEIEKNYLLIILPFMSLGFSLGIKYQAFLYVPWFILLGWKRLDITIKTWRPKLLYLLFGLCIMGLIPSPFYIRNLLELGNPVWPLMQSLFFSSHDYLYHVTQRTTSSLQGTISLSTYFHALITLIKEPLIPATIFILGLTGLLYVSKNKLLIKTGVISFFAVLFILRPSVNWRYGIFILPILAILSVFIYQNTRNKIVKLFFVLLTVITLGYGLFIAVWYSYGLIKPYYIDKNINEYHKATWYYQEYMWINKHLPENVKLLVIVSSGHTYYLDRKYLRADNLSGLINWPSLKNVKEFKDKLIHLKIDYIFYDQNQCTPHIKTLFKDLLEKTDSEIVWSKDVELCSSRIRNKYHKSTVILIKINM